MEPLNFYYYTPKVVIGSIGLLLFDSGLTSGVIFSSDPATKILCSIVLAILLAVSYFALMDGVIPAIKREVVFTVNEQGITDISSWGLIPWSNIKNLSLVQATSTYKSSGYSFKQMTIVLNNRNSGDIQNTRWKRFKLRWTRIFYGKGIDIVIDIDALRGDATDAFGKILAYQEKYSNKVTLYNQ